MNEKLRADWIKEFQPLFEVWKKSGMGLRKFARRWKAQIDLMVAANEKGDQPQREAALETIINGTQIIGHTRDNH
jgi:hypothetical protein